MSNDVGLNFLNSLLGGLMQGAQTENDVVVEANFKIRLADPKRVAPVIQVLSENKQESNEPQGAGFPIQNVPAGVRMPDAVSPQRAVPGAAPPPVPGARVDATTRQVQDYTLVPPESPELVPNTISVAPDYNPEYQNQFDRYLRTKEFDYMYGPALRGVGAPRPSTPRF
tara:strand:- start:1655 stop:2161 length:507 start_codon:yes stop_codon:yes gene_type:complete